MKIPHAKENYFQWEFLRSPCLCKGNYASFAEAQADIPAGKSDDHSDKNLAKIYEHNIGNFNPGDRPMFPWFSTLLPRVRTVFDLGGNIGLAYYAFRECVTLPRHLRWVVCEVPEVVRTGREIGRTKNAPQLEFTEQREMGDGADVYASFEALQYIEEPFAAILGKLRARPKHILINRVPLWEGESFITLQNNVNWFFPYKVQNRTDFIESITSLRYNLIADWRIGRSFDVLTDSVQTVKNYYGMYFRRK